MLVLGIETSCDETAAAVVRTPYDVLSNVVYSQVKQHEAYGGVVPEIASRAHVEVLPSVIEQALSDAAVDWGDLDALAVTFGPGLASSLLVGLTAAKALAFRTGLPLIGVHHLEGHITSIFMGDGAPDPGEACPLVVLLVTGGHTCLFHLQQPGAYVLLGQTLDDAVGEALDKGAQLLGLGYPGGPLIEALAKGGDPGAVRFPRGLEKGTQPDRELCFSYSGLKTALRYHLEKNEEVKRDQQAMADIAASYQEAAFEALTRRLLLAAERVEARGLACVGGVARNQRLRSMLDGVATQTGLPLYLAPLEYCTDNAAMIAAVAAGGGGLPVPSPYRLDVRPSLALA